VGISVVTRLATGKVSVATRLVTGKYSVATTLASGKSLSCNHTCNWRKVSIATTLTTKEILSCNHTYNSELSMFHLHLQLENTRLQSLLQVEKVSVATTLATGEKSQLQPHLQLKKFSVATTLTTLNYLCSISTCNWNKLLVAATTAIGKSHSCKSICNCKKNKAHDANKT
jgi:hypothetical protein